MPYIYGLDWSYLVFVLPTLLLALWAQANVKSTFSKYSKVSSYQGMTGYEAARRILDANGLSHVTIERVAGSLSDHYDPKADVIRLSESVYGVKSAAAVGVAAHEAGHAVQYATDYTPIKLRAAIIPVTNFGSALSWPMILLGILLSTKTLAVIGIILFSLSVVFQLLTLPVEFNASGRALTALEEGGLPQEHLQAAKKVLTAAALTYVAALATAIGHLLRLITIVNRRGWNDRR